MQKEKEICKYFGHSIIIEQCSDENGNYHDFCCDSCSTTCPQECCYCQCE